jgi:glutathione synthase/RimK-type ligase-like ATP-grasp enzyme
VIRNLDELNADDSSEYWSEIIAKDREFRVYCFFGYVIAVAEKIPHDKDALLWNHAQGGSVFNNVRWGQWPIAVMREALKSQQVMNFEVGGVDVMTEGGTPYILEVNSAPSLTTPYRKQIFARAYEWAIRYIEEHNSKPKMRAEVPDTADWKDYILPFIRR